MRRHAQRTTGEEGEHGLAEEHREELREDLGLDDHRGAAEQRGREREADRAHVLSVGRRLTIGDAPIVHDEEPQSVHRLAMSGWRTVGGTARFEFCV